MAKTCVNLIYMFSKKALNLLFAIAAISVLVFVITYFYQFHGDLSHKSDDWGNFGAYMGGLGSIFGLASLYLLITTYKLQSTELETTRNMAKEQGDFQRNEAEKKEYYSAMELFDKNLELYFDREFKVEANHPAVSKVTTNGFVTFRKCLDNSASGATNVVIPRSDERVNDTSTLNAFEEIARLIERLSDTLSEYDEKFQSSITTRFYKEKYYKTAAKLRIRGYIEENRAAFILKQ